MQIKDYARDIRSRVLKDYRIAEKAREKGLDPSIKVEIPLTETLAEKVIGLVSTIYPQVDDPRIVKRILELEKEYGLLDHGVSLKIAEEIAKEKFCKFASFKEAIDAGIRVGFAYITSGVVCSPLEGYTGWEIKKTRDGKDYMCIYYSGPVRSAGGTSASFSVLIADHVREVLGYAKYDPTDIEIKRVVREVFDYHERCVNLQYVPSEKELEYLVRNLQIQIDGLPSEDKEVYNYKDLERIKTNFIRNGVALVLGEGLAQKAHKILKIIRKVRKQGFKLSDWDWFENFVKLKDKEQESKKKEESSATYISDIVAGRPVLGHPRRGGGFRLRYGKCRTSGLSSMAMSPLTMGVLKDYIAVGTQLKYEGPGKSSAMSLCDDIEGPILKLNDGSVKRINSLENLSRYKSEMKEVLFLGDFLVNYAEFFNRGKHFEKPGYVEEWYAVELEKALGKEKNFTAEKVIENWREEISFDDAVSLSNKFKIPLHPKYIYYWKEINRELFFGLIDWIGTGEIRDGKLVLSYTSSDRERFVKGKRALELIGCEHEVSIENVVLDKSNTKALLFNLGIDFSDFNNSLNEVSKKIKKIQEDDVLEIVNKLCMVKIKDKSGTWIGARMGRPEKAKLRKLTGSPHVLFPVGEEGGRLRSFQAALEVGYVKAEFPTYCCEKCKRDCIYPKCWGCGGDCKKVEKEGRDYSDRKLDIRGYFDNAKKLAGVSLDELPVVVKGVRGTSSKDHSCEHLAKGLLRAKYNLHVNKDGTIRYDITEMPLTHFKPSEIGTSFEKLREIGYDRDFEGNEIISDNQLIELMPQDVILPACPESQDEKADDVFVKVSQYIDDLLNNF